MDSSLQIVANDREQGRAIWFLNGLSFIKLSSRQTGGALSVVLDHLPAGRETPYHLHRKEDETFHILEGEATIYSGSQKIKGTAGTTIFLPRNLAHGFRADTAAKMLIVTTPGGFDEFVVEAGEPAAALTLPEPREPDFHKLTTLAAKYGIEILGPLPE
jgi:quercetin dioxygenase-like cupin family protein